MNPPAPTVWNSRACLELARLAKDQHPDPCMVPATAATALCVAGVNAVAQRLYRHLWVIDCSPQAERRRASILRRLKEPLALRVTYASCPPESVATSSPTDPVLWVRAINDGNTIGPAGWLPWHARRLTDASRFERLCVYVSPSGHPLAATCDTAVIRALGLWEVTVMAAGPVRWHWDG